MDRFSRFTLFVQVAEAGSFVAAGRQIGISASAVGKSINRLEEALGVSLFRRSTRSISLTEEGNLFLERCRRILSELEGIELELSSRIKQPRGKLRITMPLVNQLLLPSLNNFSEAFPEIELDLDFNDRIVDVVNDGFDVAFRTGEPSDSRLMMRRLGRFQMMLVASPRYLERRGYPKSQSDLCNHACLRHKWPHSGRIEDWPLTSMDVAIPATIITNNIEALIYFALNGRGIACLPDFSVQAEVSEGRLVHILPNDVRHSSTFGMLWPASRHSSRRIRALVDFMVAATTPTVPVDDAVPPTAIVRESGRIEESVDKNRSVDVKITDTIVRA